MGVLFWMIILIVISIAVLMAFMTHGFRKGFAHEVTALFSIGVAALVFHFLSSLVRDFLNEHISGVISAIIMLALIIFLYKIFHILFNAINFIAKLPLIHWLDAGTGLLAGLLEGFTVLYIGQYLLEHYLLV